MSRKKGSAKQDIFFNAYTGSNTQEAAKKARISYNYARQLLTMPHNQKRLADIAKKDEKDLKKTVMSRQELKQFWSDITKEKTERTNDRLKSSQLLGKSKAMFTDKVEVTFDPAIIGKFFEIIESIASAAFVDQIKDQIKKKISEVVR